MSSKRYSSYSLRKSDESSDEEGSNGESSSDDEHSQSKRGRVKGPETSSPTHPTEFKNPNIRKSNNVWSNVLMDQALSEEVSGVLRNKKELIQRQSESYDKGFAATRPRLDRSTLHKAELDLDLEVCSASSAALNDEPVRPLYSADAEEEHPDAAAERLLSRKRKHCLQPQLSTFEDQGGRRGRRFQQQSSGQGRKSAKERLGVKQQHTAVNKPGLGQPEITPVVLDGVTDKGEIARKIAESLREPKQELTARIVEAIGIDKAKLLYQETLEIESAGGMLILSGARRKTPGGVFIQLVKDDPDVSKEQLDQIWEEDRLNERTTLRGRRQRRPNFFQPTNVTSAGSVKVSLDMETDDDPFAASAACVGTPFGSLDVWSMKKDNTQSLEDTTVEEGEIVDDSGSESVPACVDTNEKNGDGEVQPNTPSNSLASSSPAGSSIASLCTDA